MKVISFLRKSHMLFMLFMLTAAALLFVSCSGDDPADTKPGNSTPAAGSGDWHNVPASGGTITKGDIMLAFPAGTFLTDSKVAVTELSAGEVGGEHEVSKFYEITMPSTTKAPVKITIKSREHADDIYFVERSLGHSLSYDKYIVSAYSVEGTYANGKYTMTLPAMENGKNTVNFAIGLAHVQRLEGDDPSSRADADKGGEVKWHTDINYGPKTEWFGAIPYPNFKNFGLLWMNSTQKARLQKKYPILKRSVGEAISQIQKLGYKVKTDRDIPIILTGCVDEYGFFSQSRITDEMSTITIGLEKLVASDDTITMKQTLIHELMHYFQADYDTRLSWYKAGENGEDAILKEAGAVWAEKFMNKGQLNVSFIMDYLPQSLAAGLIDIGSGYDGDAESATNHTMYQNHGYGVAPLLEYMTKKMKLDSTIELFELWRDATDKSAFATLKAWATKHGNNMFDGNNLDAYFISLLKGEVLPDIYPFQLVKNTFKISEDGKYPEHQEPCSAYGCKLQRYEININIADLDKKEFVLKQRGKDVQAHVFYYTNPRDIHWLDGTFSGGDSIVLDLSFMKEEKAHLNVFTLITNKGNKSMHMSAITPELRLKKEGLAVKSIDFDSSFLVGNQGETRNAAFGTYFSQGITTIKTSNGFTITAKRSNGGMTDNITIDMTNPNTGSPVISRVSYSSHGSQSLDVELLNVPCTFNSSDEKVFNASEEASTMKINNILYKGFDGKAFSTFVPGESSWAEITIMFDK
ncbi:MAG: hypothetical protein IJK51_09290 [Bacteroidaceae bacterium]|nr:hypothetical protein [Bacteroidaceae bacterium]